MTPETYRTALTTLGLSQLAAGRWLRVSPKTAQNYAKHGPSGPAAVAVEMRLALAPIVDSLVGYPFLIEIDKLAENIDAALKGEAGYKRVECWLSAEDVAWAKQTALDNFYTLDEFLAWCVSAKRVESE